MRRRAGLGNYSKGTAQNVNATSSYTARKEGGGLGMPTVTPNAPRIASQGPTRSKAPVKR